MSIGKRIYEHRTSNTLSQEELAERLGVSRQSVSKWETDTAVPDLDKLIKLADMFHVTLDELVGRSGSKESPVLRANTSDETKQLSMHQRIIGYILLAVSLIAGTLIVLLAQTEDGAVLSALIAATVLSCSVVCLTVTKHAGYWCAWIAFAPIVLLSPFVVGSSVYNWRMLFQLGWYILMGMVARKQFSSSEIVVTRKQTVCIILEWIAVVGLSVFSRIAINAVLIHLLLSILIYGSVAWLLTHTIAYVTRKK